MGELTFFGTGTSQGVPVIGCTCEICTSADPRDRRFRTSAGIQFNGARFIIDVGPDFRSQCLATGWDDADAVLLTHSHQDHVAGLDDLRPLIFKSKRPMPVYGDHSTMTQVVDRFHYAFGGTNYPGAPQLVPHQVEPNQSVTIAGQEITPIHIQHGLQPILGYRFGTLAYLTDVSVIPADSIDLLRNLDVLIINALRIAPHHSHINLDQALEYTEQLNPKKTYLTHISHLLGLHESISKQLPKNVFLAEDGMRINF